MTGLTLGLVLFLGIHLAKVVAWDARASFIAKRGEGAWTGLYTVVSLLGLGLIVWSYGDAAADSPFFYEPPVWMKHVNALLMLFALVFLAASLFPAGRITAAVKHPQLLSVKIWAFGHLLANGTLAAFLLFGGFLAWAVMVRISLKRRERDGRAKLPVAGPAKWDIAAVVTGLVLYGLLVMGGHAWLFGVSPL